MLSCKNCSTEFDGHYCSNCGQKYIDQRFKLKDSIAWAFHSIFNFDKGFLHTSKEMLLHPGKVVHEFLDGITIRYAHPFRFIFIWASLAAILGVWAGTFEDTGLAMNQAMGVDDEAIQRSKKIQSFMGQYMSFVMLLMIPLYAFWSFKIFKSKGYNYAEHLIANSFAMSSSIMIGIPLTIVYGLNSHVEYINYINFAIGAFVISRIYSQVFKTNWIGAFAKYLFTLILTVLSFGIIMVIVIIVVSIILAFLDIPNPIMPAKPV